MQMEVYGRIDFRISHDGTPYIFDISTMPYTTEHSSFSFAFAKLGLPYSDIYQAVITAALQRLPSRN
jgi:D-alanine-D-alanine ligase